MSHGMTPGVLMEGFSARAIQPARPGRFLRVARRFAGGETTRADVDGNSEIPDYRNEKLPTAVKGRSCVGGRLLLTQLSAV